jgi:DNA end-binding protein Ku
MADRSVASGPIVFGKLNIPVKYYKAASPETIKFKKITPAGNLMKQESLDSISEKEVSQTECNSGFEYEKGKFVVFTKEEIAALESTRTKGSVEIENFVPVENVDLIHVESSYYIKPDKGADRAFKLLADSMAVKNKAAIGYWTIRGKDNLVLLRPYKGGLLLHTLYYINEVRDYGDNCADLTTTDAEISMAGRLIDKLSLPKFDVCKYHDKFSERVLKAVEDKKKNPDAIITPGTVSAAPIVDLFAALEESLKDNSKVPLSYGFRFPIDNPVKKTQAKRVPKKGIKNN